MDASAAPQPDGLGLTGRGGGGIFLPSGVTKPTATCRSGDADGWTVGYATVGEPIAVAACACADAGADDATGCATRVGSGGRSAVGGVCGSTGGRCDGICGSEGCDGPGSSARHGSGAMAGSVAVAMPPRPAGNASQPPERPLSSCGWRPLRGGSTGRFGSTTISFGRITWAIVPPSMLARSSTRMLYRLASRPTTARPIRRNAATSTPGGSASRRLSWSIWSSDMPSPRSSTWMTT
jgi:hypothetical protein